MSTPLRRSVALRVVLVVALAAAAVVSVVAPRSPAGAGVPDVQGQVNAAHALGESRGERNAVAVLDRATGRFWGAGDVDAGYASASVVKVAIATQLLVTGQMSGSVADQAWSMITRSDDAAASALYPRVGGDGVMPAVAARYGLSQYFGRPTSPGWWGLTQITAEGIVRLYDKLATDPVVANWLFSAMAATSCTAADGWPQCTGLPSVAVGWRVKQGWMCCLDGLTRMHSTGLVNGDRYAVALLTEGSRSVYGAYGRDTLTGMARALLPDGYVVDPHRPVGNVDAVTSDGGTVTVQGWSTDPDTPGTPEAVDVYVDGGFVTRTTASLDRPDVAAATGYSRTSGFRTGFVATDGAHRVCAYGIDTGTGGVNPQLGCLDVVVSGAAVGFVDGLNADPGRTGVRGWALDPDAPTTPLAVDLYVDGTFAGKVTANVQRDDVVAATGRSGAHGFVATVPTSPGPHTVCAFAFGTDGRVAPVGCQRGGYDGTPTGVLDTARPTGTWLRVAGWVRDPDTTSPAGVDVWAGSSFLGHLDATRDRPDVQAALGVPGARGFDGVVTVPVGVSRPVVYALNSGPGGGNPAVGSVTVTGSTRPVGSLDGVDRVGSVLRATGWAADPDAGAGPVTVTLQLDGAPAGQATADRARDDVTAATGIPGRHGFVVDVPAATGGHTLCATAQDVGPARSDVSLGCVSTSR